MDNSRRTADHPSSEAPSGAQDAAAHDDLLVRHDAAAGRYEAVVDGRTVGVAQAHERDGRVVFTHTEVDQDLQRKGVASDLVQYALDDVRRRGLRVVALCPFVAAYVRKHREYDDLVDPAEG